MLNSSALTFLSSNKAKQSMKATLAFAMCMVVVGTVLDAFAADSFTEAAELVRTGNTWKKGQEIPAKLLKYHTSDDGSCFPNPRGTDVLSGTLPITHCYGKLRFCLRLLIHGFSRTQSTGH
jgi:hypothetical protein